MHLSSVDDKLERKQRQRPASYQQDKHARAAPECLRAWRLWSSGDLVPTDAEKPSKSPPNHCLPRITEQGSQAVSLSVRCVEDAIAVVDSDAGPRDGLSYRV